MSDESISTDEVIAWSQQNIQEMAPMYQLYQMTEQLVCRSQYVQREAQLTDVLLQTEMRALQLSQVSNNDLFAAGIMSSVWLESCATVKDSYFDDTDDRRAWSAAIMRLDSIRGNVWRDARLRERADSVFGAIRMEYQLLKRFERIPASYIDGLCNSMSENELRGPAFVSLAVLGLVLPLLVSVVAAAAYWMGFHLLFDILLRSVLPLMLMVLGGIAIYGMHLSSDARRTKRTLLWIHGMFSEWRAFLHNPYGGQMLRQAREKHPALRSPLPVVERPVRRTEARVERQSVIVVERYSAAPERIIERQTVVARCKYCQGLTPVDTPKCQNCGAIKFI